MDILTYSFFCVFGIPIHKLFPQEIKGCLYLLKRVILYIKIKKINFKAAFCTLKYSNNYKMRECYLNVLKMKNKELSLKFLEILQELFIEYALFYV